MSSSAGSKPSTASDAQLKLALENLLGDYFKEAVKIVRLERSGYEYSSSFVIEEIEIELGNGADLSVIFKDLSNRGLLEEARRTKPEFLFDPVREIEMYRSILSRSQSGTAAYYGSVVDRQSDTFWLFLEKVPGVELYQRGEFDFWLESARWLAGFHDEFQPEIDKLAARVPLIRYDRTYYRTWLRRAQTFLGTGQMASPSQIYRLSQGYGYVLEQLLALPVTLLHGDFYPSNVIVRNDSKERRICPVDWEMVAAGPGIIDLAALVSGGWTEQQERKLIMAYRDALSPRSVSQVGTEEFFKYVSWGQLHLAIQWLGWSSSWSPPDEHRQDWLKIALEMLDRLGENEF